MLDRPRHLFTFDGWSGVGFWEIDKQTGEAKVIATGSLSTGTHATDLFGVDDGEISLVGVETTRTQEATTSEVFRLDIATGQRTGIDSASEPAHTRHGGLFRWPFGSPRRDGDRIYTIKNNDIVSLPVR